ncbi:hypothetical protein DJ568_01675 [Mucilaginibacter hurinus]|uniref:Uncharacterized protein n=1 Tax=Mucilaginibacter hurinus TaxID=2201324 RepID=A0A367GT49_9SPHI|nr:hypothetical protein [Mucilaginibacter hurinus]RCH56594.1 hypothetical protein DJ568_01675 [Mucilaginibacter hurinus]
MKIFYVIITALFFAAAIVSNTGCKRGTIIEIDTITNTKPTGGNSEISWKKNGVSEKAALVTTVYDTNSNVIQIAGIFGEPADGAVSITLNAPQVADFNIEPGVIFSYNTSTTDANQQYLGETGTVKVTSLTADRIEGTFEAQCKSINGTGTVTITEGKFSCKIVPLTAP